MSEFKDIEIVEMDEEASYQPDLSSALYDIVLRLSYSAPYDWTNYFNSRWEQNFYMMKRRAHVSGDSLTIHCVPDELQNSHLPELKKIIAETNQKYREHLAVTKAQEQASAEHEAAEKLKLKDIKNGLKF